MRTTCARPARLGLCCLYALAEVELLLLLLLQIRGTWSASVGGPARHADELVSLELERPRACAPCPASAVPGASRPSPTAAAQPHTRDLRPRRGRGLASFNRGQRGEDERGSAHLVLEGLLRGCCWAERRECTSRRGRKTGDEGGREARGGRGGGGARGPDRGDAERARDGCWPVAIADTRTKTASTRATRSEPRREERAFGKAADEEDDQVATLSGSGDCWIQLCTSTTWPLSSCRLRT